MSACPGTSVPSHCQKRKQSKNVSSGDVSALPDSNRLEDSPTDCPPSVLALSHDVPGVQPRPQRITRLLSRQLHMASCSPNYEESPTSIAVLDGSSASAADFPTGFDIQPTRRVRRRLAIDPPDISGPDTSPSKQLCKKHKPCAPQPSRTVSRRCDGTSDSRDEDEALRSSIPMSSNSHKQTYMDSAFMMNSLGSVML